jgi:hypothetical protein
VYGVFLDLDDWDAKRAQGVSGIIDLECIVQAFGKTVSGKKGRFLPLVSWQAFEADGNKALEALKELFHCAHVTQGRFFADDATEDETAKVLKRNAVTAKEDGGNHER